MSRSEILASLTSLAGLAEEIAKRARDTRTDEDTLRDLLHWTRGAVESLRSALEEPESDACAGCGAVPGDGLTAGCVHGEGCGYWRAQELELAIARAVAEEDYDGPELMPLGVRVSCRNTLPSDTGEEPTEAQRATAERLLADGWRFQDGFGMRVEPSWDEGRLLYVERGDEQIGILPDGRTTAEEQRDERARHADRQFGG